MRVALSAVKNATNKCWGDTDQCKSNSDPCHGGTDQFQAGTDQIHSGTDQFKSNSVHCHGGTDQFHCATGQCHADPISWIQWHFATVRLSRPDQWKGAIDHTAPGRPGWHPQIM